MHFSFVHKIIIETENDSIRATPQIKSILSFSTHVNIKQLEFYNNIVGRFTA